MGSDFVPVFFQGEVARIQKMEFQVLQIPFVWVGSFGGENVVVLSPNYQRGWLVVAEVLLPNRVVRHVGLVAVEQLELYRCVAFTGQVLEVDVPIVRTDGFWIAYAMGVLPFDAIALDKTG